MQNTLNTVARSDTKASYRLSLRMRRTILAYLFLVPAIFYFSVYFFYPIAVELRASLYSGQPLIGNSEYEGLANYWHAVHDKRVLNSLRVTAIYAAGSTVFTIIIGLGLALILDQPFRGRNIIRSIIFFPYMISIVIVALMWRNILDPYLGILNNILLYLNFPIQNWLSNVKQALPTIIGITVWQYAGYAMVIYLAGLQNIPKMYYEAAEIDGANSLTKFRYITWPLLAPTTFFIAVVNMITYLQWMAPAYLITRGGPAEATQLYAFHVFNVAFTELNIGYASALSFIMFLVIFMVTLAQFRFSDPALEY